ncbi:alpha-N-acetylglucosaminidase [Lipingzhangella halophila]|uniref:Alpha-N-acetylglucosaminidase n=1 Tax=Lipingzhangella halophila TaxID=1783352 RepID=A0A7W7RI82_9ACTN|nr:alpha-N-acetylglucosaminidase [Lipingzhangella halophila]MBB4932377.1 alpha-N-acetylglucosaminidase [Lipingzhangella halophila]
MSEDTDGQRAAAPERGTRHPAHGLLGRVLGERAHAFDLDVCAPAPEQADMFEVAATAGRVSIRATSGVAAASALRHYLVHACDRYPTWDDTEVALPDPLPSLDRETVTSPWSWRYYLNFCAFAYTTLYWDWARWEREIDWMALHGVNLPLCIVGQELVWLRTLREFGVSDERARAFIGGPAFFPWMAMGCVHDHGTTVTDSWLADRADLAHRILDRQRSLGMTPVLPGFPGYLPAELAGARASRVDWMGFDNRALDPADPLFHSFGRALLREQEREYGTGHYYAIDPFIEGVPPNGETAAVAESARAVSRTLREHDERGVWVLQGWPFTYRSDFWSPDRVEAFLGAIPAEQLLVLDLWAEHSPAAERTDYFAGRSWLWCMLHSLGGRPGMHGQMRAVAAEPGRIAALPEGGGLRGVGASTECLNRDPVLYELLADVAWHGEVPSLERWLRDYARRRCGRDDEGLREAWRILGSEVYAGTEQSGPPVSVVASRPRVDHGLEPWHPLNLTAPRAEAGAGDPLLRAWDLLLDSASRSGATAGMRRDLVDVGDMVLSGLAAQQYAEVVAAYQRRDPDGLDRAGSAFLETMADLDLLASTIGDYRLDTWLAGACAWGRTESERAALVCDARRLLTCWVEPGHVLQDYAGRHWSGLVSGYYLPRWRLWLRTLRSALARGGEPDADRFDAEVTMLEESWLQETRCGPAESARDPVAVAAMIRAKCHSSAVHRGL